MTKAIVLAAGKGTRMKSKIPKVLHKVAGQEIIKYVLNVLSENGIENTALVLGYEAEKIDQALESEYKYFLQEDQLGTGHAVMQAEAFLEKGEDVIVICGDTPLFRKETIEGALEIHEKNDAEITVLTSVVENSFGYGRIVKDADNIVGIVEEKDATEEEKEIKEINTGTYIFKSDFLIDNLKKIGSDNAQNEYYLTDLIKLAKEQSKSVQGYIVEDEQESLGINDRVQLSMAEKVIRNRKLEELMLDGVTIIDPDSVYIGKNVRVGQDTVIYPNVYLEGDTQIGEDNKIGPDTRIVDSIIGNNNNIERAKVLEAKLASNCNIGPFAYLRPGADLSDNVKIGDFVEIKKSNIGKGSKVPHLAYVGDAEIGTKVNIGCGTITCNYDGVNKHKTIVGDNAFIGSNTNLVAPVKIGEGAYVGAGSTITKDVPKSALAIARGRQKNIENYK